MIIIGLTGQPSSGKDTVAEYLVSLGFEHISTSDLIREEMKKSGLPLERSSLSQFANEKRKERGPGYLASLAIQKVNGNSVISGLRNPSEVDILRAEFKDNFICIAIEAPIDIRYVWAKNRGRIGDSISFEQFKKEEEVERQGNRDSQQVDAVIKMADKLVINDSTKENLINKVNEIVKEYSI